MKLFSLFVPVEFSNYDFRENWKFYHNILTALLLFTTLSVEIFSKRSKVALWAKFLVTIPLVMVIFLSLVFLFLGACKWEEIGILYKERNGNAVIANRGLNCGATTDYSYRTFYMRPMTPFFNFVWKIDAKSLNKSEWINLHSVQD